MTTPAAPTKPAPSGTRYPLAWLLGGTFGGLTAIAVAVVLFLGMTGTRETTRELLGLRTQVIVDGVTNAIYDQLRPIEQQALWISERVADGRLDPNNTENWTRTVAGVISSTPQVFAAILLTPDMTGGIYSKITEQLLIRDWSNQPEMVQLMGRISALPSKSLHWGEPAVSRELSPPQTMLVLRTPLRRDDQLLGILMFTVTLSDLSKILVESAGDEPIVPYIIYDERWVLAHPQLVTRGAVTLNLENLSQTDRVTIGAGALKPLNELGDPLLAGLRDAEPASERIVAAIPNATTLLAEVDGVLMAYVVRKIDDFGDRPWIVGTYFDASLAEVQIKRLRDTALAGGIVFVISIILAILIGRRTAMPAQRLAIAAHGVQNGDLGDAVHVPTTRIKELDQAGQSFNDMVDGLRDREMIREQFGRFVPEAIAATILEEEGVLQPVTTEATVLFTDLEGFTAMSEDLEPNEIIEVLNEFFSAAVNILERHSGVVTQFQGDAILATFNVPAPDERHGANAVAAALELQYLTETHTFAGHELRCRIGVNTGPLVAGAVGASGRLNYTVHGDAVNLAARLEQMNKEYGTRILVSASTVDIAGEQSFRKIGTVSVRGKEHPVDIFTPDDNPTD